MQIQKEEQRDKGPRKRKQKKLAHNKTDLEISLQDAERRTKNTKTNIISTTRSMAAHRHHRHRHHHHHHHNYYLENKSFGVVLLPKASLEKSR
jgi:hypothetical protein